MEVLLAADHNLSFGCLIINSFNQDRFIFISELGVITPNRLLGYFQRLWLVKHTIKTVDWRSWL